jgi:RND family efflux transporter MFP subunit
MKSKYIIITISLLVILGWTLRFIVTRNLSASGSSGSGVTTTSVQFVTSTITADGTVTAQNQATLNFLTAGKLTYLPLKAGDPVYSGQVIAQLDTYALQRSLTLALNAYQATRDTFDQTQDNLNNNIIKSQTAASYSNAFDSIDTVNAAIARIANQTQLGLNNSVINVELANYALQLSKLVSPLKGILTREDVTVAGVNVTPATTFTVADPSTMVFRANVPVQDIYYISLGSPVTISVDGIKDQISGTVIKIFPSKITLGNGEAVYQVDIQSDQLKKLAKLDETGTAIITTNSENVALIPAWTVLGGKYVWVDENRTPILKEVTVGKIHGNEIEILGGLTSDDKVITDPKFIPSQKYQIL